MEIPDGYVGWVTIRYEFEHCPDGDTGPLVSTIRVQPDGWGCSTTWNGSEGLTLLRYYYVDERGRRIRELKSTGWGEGGEIWAGSTSLDQDKHHFFVGSEAKFKAMKIGPEMADRLRGRSSNE